MSSIYESPDGGKTVFVREGNINVPLDMFIQRRDQMRKQQCWSDIHSAAKTDAALQDLLDRAEVYYKLKYSHAKD